jgi:hypothetical protein
MNKLFSPLPKKKMSDIQTLPPVVIGGPAPQAAGTFSLSKIWTYGTYTVYGFAFFIAGVFLYYLIRVLWVLGDAFYTSFEDAFGGFAAFVGWLGEHSWLIWLGVGLAAFMPLAGYSWQAWKWVSEKVSSWRGKTVDLKKQPKIVQEWTFRRAKAEVKIGTYNEKIDQQKLGSKERERLIKERDAYQTKFNNKFDKTKKLNDTQRKNIKDWVGKTPKFKP